MATNARDMVTALPDLVPEYEPLMSSSFTCNEPGPFGYAIWEDWYHNPGDIDWSQEFPRTPESTQMMEDHDLSMLDDIDYDVPAAKQAMFDAIKGWFDYTGADG